MPQRELNIVVLGSGGVGKSCLTAQFVQNIWIESYDPTIEDSYRKQIQVDGRQVMLEILDTAGTEQFTAMRELYMKTGDGFLLVFSITQPNSLAELTTLQSQLTRIKADPKVPVVLVGNKSDLDDQRAVGHRRAEMLAESWGGKPYYETSARNRTNVDEVFVDLCRQILRRDKERGQNGVGVGGVGGVSSQGRGGGAGGGEKDTRRDDGRGGDARREKDYRPRDRERDRERKDDRDDDRRGRRRTERRKREQRCTIL